MDRIQEIEKKMELKEKLSEEEINYYISIAQDDPEKLYEISELYFDGVCVEKDYKKSFKYCDKAAELGHVEALDDLGYMYQKGLGVKRDYQKAIEYYEKATEKGNDSALNSLGYMYQNGLGVEQNYEKALEYYEKAVEKGNTSALCNLGYMYLEGSGVEQNYENALEYYEKASLLGDADAEMIVLNNRFLRGENIDIKNLFEKWKPQHEGDLYFEKIKFLIDSGSEIISLDNIKNLSKAETINIDQNERIKMSIKSLLNFLNEHSDDTIVYLKSTNNYFSSVCQDFYTVSDMKKIVKTCNKILSCIDFNQPEQDIVTQIYIKLGYFIHYDFLAAGSGKYVNERKSTSRNLMVFLNRKGLCQGQAVALDFLFDIVDIDCNVLFSNLKNHVGHVYNQIKIGGKWYNCDVTNDAAYIKLLLTPIFFLRSKKSFSEQWYHQSLDETQEHEANEDYPNVDDLFKRNLYKLFSRKINSYLEKLDMPIEQLITPAGVKECGGRTR